jgi:hypothetical protein
MSISICSHPADFAQQNENNDVYCKPPAALVLAEEPVEIPKQFLSICLEDRIVYEVIELGDEHSRGCYLAVEWIGFILGFGYHA